jgi:hypothetical protein
MKDFSLVQLAIFSAVITSCSSSWTSDSKLNAQSIDPSSLTTILGPPAALVDQTIPPGKRKTKEYRYFVLDRRGAVQFRSYFYEGNNWVTTQRPFSDEKGSDVFRVLDIKNPKDAELISSYIAKNPYLSL